MIAALTRAARAIYEGAQLAREVMDELQFETPQPRGEESEMSEFPPDFSAREWDCHDGTPVPEELVPAAARCARNLQPLRDWFRSPVIITSGYRTPAHNAAVGGAEQSYHLGRAEEQILAADFRVLGVDIRRAAEILEGLIRIGAIEEGGVGVYRDWIHYDPRGHRARWTG